MLPHLAPTLESSWSSVFRTVRWRLRTLILYAAGFAAPSPAVAQALDSLPLSTRIRADVFTTEMRFGKVRVQPLVGILAGVREGHLLLLVRPGDDTLRVPRSSVREVFVSRGMQPRWVAALQRAIIPALASASFRAISLNIHRGEGDPSPGTGALQGAAVSGAFGALLGFISPRERWKAVSGVPPAGAGQLNGVRP